MTLFNEATMQIFQDLIQLEDRNHGSGLFFRTIACPEVREAEKPDQAAKSLSQKLVARYSASGQANAVAFWNSHTLICTNPP
jgi:hypothetical protein